MQIFGHRGAAGEAPENTIAGARHAISRGTRYVEIDLRLSADNQLVIVHDNSTERTCGRVEVLKIIGQARDGGAREANTTPRS